VRDLFDDQLVAYWSLILYIFVPAKLYYFPILNTITPVPILLCAWLWLRALRSRRPMYAIALGVATCGVMLFDPLALVMGLLFVAIVPLALGKAGEPWQAVLAPAGLAVAGFAGAWLGLRLTFQLDLIATFRAVAAEAASFNVVAHRPYAIWVRQNVPDFAFGMGVSQAVIGCLSCGYAVYRAFKAGFDEPITIYCLAVGAVLLLTDVAGVNRGEVIRLWIFLACFFQVPAAYLCARLESRVAVMLVVGTTLFQDILGTAMLSFVRP